MPDTAPGAPVLDACLPGVSRLAYGCMHLGGESGAGELAAGQRDRALAAVDAALDAGINLFDHADIYTTGKSERVFGDVLRARPGLREKIFLQSKGGIVLASGANRYDLSRRHIVACVEGSLARLGVDYLDVWLLHRPDPLMAPAEIAAAFEALETAGKVRFFGVSNMRRTQIALLQSALSQPLLVNQLEMSLRHLDWLDDGVDFNTATRPAGAVGATIDHCRQHGIQLQAWGALAQGAFSGAPDARHSNKARRTADLAREMATIRRVDATAIVLAFLLRHPASIQPLIGSTRPERIRAAAAARDVRLSHEEWYALYQTARGEALP